MGGCGLVLTEATAVAPEGRISPQDLGIWNDEQRDRLASITEFIRGQGAVAGVQLAHAGRKASTHAPWTGDGGVSVADGGWQPLAPSALTFAENYIAPRAMTSDDINHLVDQFGRATERAYRAGFQVVEVHMAHGYLLHEFLSPLANQRTDEFGGTLENRMRVPLAVARTVRDAFPADLPVFARISASDWHPGGWTVEESVVLARELKHAGIDFIDCSSGGIIPHAKIEVKPGYQVPFAERVRKEAAILTGAVGLITEPEQAELILREGQADAVLLARELLRDPYWAWTAARKLGVNISVPQQYERGRPRART